MSNGPGYSTPLEAFKSGSREKILYVICICSGTSEPKHHDYLATVDVDPDSSTYSQVIHRTYANHIGDELHHFGWNTCSSCYGDPKAKRDKLILPALGSDRIYVLDVGNERAPQIIKEITPEEVRKFNVTALHTTHCLPSGDMMISTMGDIDGNGKGDFLILDGKTFNPKGLWTTGRTAKFGYDFWYQPYYDVLIASEWGAPRCFKSGYDAEQIKDKDIYGRSLNVYSWSKGILLQTIDLGDDGLCPFEIRFLHNPKSSQGFVGCVVNSNIFRFWKNEDGTWAAEKVIDIPSKKVSGWISREMSGMITDILISMDDRYLYFSNWLHGDVRQYDITKTTSPKLVGQIFLGGKLLNDSPVKVTYDPENVNSVEPVYVKGCRLHGSPQMLQLSLDGKRLYVTTSLYSPWDKQIYPELMRTGSTLVKLDVNTEKGGLTLDPNFLIDFGKEPDGPVLAHECRYPGGDCTSDIFVADYESGNYTEETCCCKPR